MHTTIPLSATRAGLRDDVVTCRSLSEIAWRSRDKEDSIRRAIGPHSIPAESHYPKSFRIPAKKEGGDE